MFDKTFKIPNNENFETLLHNVQKQFAFVPIYKAA